jgi:hypothetical protein
LSDGFLFSRPLPVCLFFSTIKLILPVHQYISDPEWSIQKVSPVCLPLVVIRNVAILVCHYEYHLLQFAALYQHWRVQSSLSTIQKAIFLHIRAVSSIQERPVVVVAVDRDTKRHVSM